MKRGEQRIGDGARATPQKKTRDIKKEEMKDKGKAIPPSGEKGARDGNGREAQTPGAQRQSTQERR